MHKHIDVDKQALVQYIDQCDTEEYQQGYRDAIEKFKSPYWQGYLQAAQEMIDKQRDRDHLEQYLKWFHGQMLDLDD